METLGMIRRDVWRGKRVFLTGHTGFKGAWLSLWLKELGAQVTGFSLAAPTTPNLFDLTKAAEGLTDLRGDIRDLPALAKAMTDARPELVIHMAAQPLVRASYADPVGTYATNVMGTTHVLESVRKTPSVRGVLIVTTDKCYENREWVWGYREDEAMGGYDPYSSSKGCAELVTSAYRRSYFHPEAHGRHGVAIATARAGNVIGGGDWAEDRLVPDAMRAFLSGKILDIRNPDAVRPWQHVLDPLAGYLQLSQELLGDKAASYAQGWNFGPHEDSERTVGQVLTILADRWGAGASWRIAGDPAQWHEAHYLRLDCSKAHRALNWRPRYDLTTALGMTADWYRAYQAGQDLAALTHRQIEDAMGNAPIAPARLGKTAHGQ